MITKGELGKLLASTETCRVERTKSTTDKDKFGKAVCAFTNVANVMGIATLGVGLVVREYF